MSAAAETLTAAMAAEVQAAALGVDASTLDTTSSPISLFASPALQEAPSTDHGRSHTSSCPRLSLVSAGIPNLGAMAHGPADHEDDDEFVDELALDLSPEVCDRLEAESVRDTTQAEAVSHSEHDGGMGKKRPCSITCFDALDDNVPAIKRTKIATQAEPIKPFFEEAWVQQLLTGRDRAPAPLPPEESPTDASAIDAAPTDAIPADASPTDGHTQLPAATQKVAVVQMTPTEAVDSSPSTSEDGFCLVRVARTSSDAVPSDEGDEDVPLALLSSAARTNEPGEPEPTAVLAAITKVRDAVRELQRAYRLETLRVAAHITEQQLAIDQLRAKLRTRKPKKAA
ncbi:hypothetical protein PaG_01173 [Moesziomyces aphidis]|uniref:Uncharacterized protein n=1 Tax=Moesziomyces aphidis TaxID=84754 RepID=W3VU51_MOEAP|nr:hypothetical protein PaG_01173 [Moesziomyces aphidis]